MGFYLRKSVKVGPFRFNLSKSGVGVSAGIKGLRVGTGPRGNYVHMSRNGLYYRATIPSSKPTHSGSQNFRSTHQEFIPKGTHDPLQEIESADVSQIVDSSSRELLDEMNTKQKRIRLMPLVAGGFGFVLFISLSSGWPSWANIAIVVLGIIGSYAANSYDLLKKTVVLFYEFDQEMEKTYGLLHGWAEKLASSKAVWHIEAQGRVRDKKYHAGASSLVNRNSTFIRKSAPPNLKTNVETVAIGVGRQTLHFFPDRLLVYDKNGVGAVSYDSLQMHVRPSRFIESDSVPGDAKIIDHTWKYVNKSGGPDKRFKDNVQMPICLYDEISFSSVSGLNEVIQVSQTGLADNFMKAIQYLGSKVPREAVVAG